MSKLVKFKKFNMAKYKKVSLLIYESKANHLSINKIEFTDVNFTLSGNFILVETVERDSDGVLLSQKIDIFNLEEVKSYKIEY